jgi:hypothetical protein
MKRDLRRLMAMLSEAGTRQLELPFGVEKRDLEVPYLTRNGAISRRPLRIYLPDHAPEPMPLVFIAHYEMPEHDPLLGMYLRMGWAVSTCLQHVQEYNSQLMGDNLVFNSAALTMVRKQPDIDRTRIVVSGGSAGGYMTMMLSVLHMGVCASVSFSGIANLVFNMRYMQAANSFNLQVMAGLTEEERQDFVGMLEKLPIPILGAISNQFLPILMQMEQEPDSPMWTAASPVCMADRFTGPLLMTHFTSDVLVPIDQLTKRWSDGLNGESLPEGYRLRLSEFPLPAHLQRSLEENLPRADLAVQTVPAPQREGEDIRIPFDISKRFNIVVFDEGAVEGVAGHSKQLQPGSYDARAYMEAQIRRSCRETNWLTAGKLALMAERYAGKCILLPAHDGIDDQVYGSNSVHRREVMEELSLYAEDHGADLRDKMREVKQERPDLAAVLDEIVEQLG